MAGIRVGDFPADPSQRSARGCPAFFVCGPVPPGTLQKEFLTDLSGRSPPHRLSFVAGRPAEREGQTKMNTHELLDYDDLGDALREGRALRPARGYRILFAQDDLNFRPLGVPIPCRSAASFSRPPRSTRAMATACSRSCRPATSRTSGSTSRSTCAERGAERFVAFLTDRDFKFDAELDHELSAGASPRSAAQCSTRSPSPATRRPSSSRCAAAKIG